MAPRPPLRPRRLPRRRLLPSRAGDNAPVGRQRRWSRRLPAAAACEASVRVAAPVAAAIGAWKRLVGRLVGRLVARAEETPSWTICSSRCWRRTRASRRRSVACPQRRQLCALHPLRSNRVCRLRLPLRRYRRRLDRRRRKFRRRRRSSNFRRSCHSIRRRSSHRRRPDHRRAPLSSCLLRGASARRQRQRTRLESSAVWWSLWGT